MSKQRVNKKRFLWILKLFSLAFSIYWLFTDGFKKSFGETMGITNNLGKMSKEPLSFVDKVGIIVMVLFVVFVIVSNILNYFRKKPK